MPTRNPESSDTTAARFRALRSVKDKATQTRARIAAGVAAALAARPLLVPPRRHPSPKATASRANLEIAREAVQERRQTVREIVFAACSTHTEKGIGEIWLAVQDDWGTIDIRTVHRHVSYLVSVKRLVRVGDRNHGTYLRARVQRRA